MNVSDSRKFLLPVILVALVLLAWGGTVGSPLREHSLDASAQRYVDDGLKRALVTFATARTINAVLSTVQGTSLAIEPLGIGVQLSVGQALHPVNQIVGQFADWMLAASVAFGVMEVLVRIGSSWPVTVALTGAICVWAWCWSARRSPPAWLARTVLVLVLVRFAVPVVSLGSAWVYAGFLASDYAASQAAISASAQKVDGQAGPATVPSDQSPSGGIIDWTMSKLWPRNPESKPEPGLFDRIKGETTTRIAALSNAAEALIQHVVKLMVVFLLQTLVIPLLLLWIVGRIVKNLFAGAAWSKRPISAMNESPRRRVEPSQ